MLEMKIFILVSIFGGISFGSINSTLKQSTSGEDYYNYDYDLPLNTSSEGGSYSKADALILPVPELPESKNVHTFENDDDILPDDSLADSDLRDHNFIDNLMYVYYGPKNKNNNKYGPEVIVIGSVLSCAAQLLTIFCILLKRNQGGRKENSKVFLHLMGCMCMANLIFMLGVHATKSAVKCEIVAVLLHYLHLVTAFWIFLYCHYVYQQFSKHICSPTKCMYFLAYGLPSLISLTSLVITPNSYETRKFCFVSVQRGMLLNYMFPVSCLIVATTVYALNGIRRINLELSKLDVASSAESLNILKNEILNNENAKHESPEIDGEIASLKECKTCFKLLCILQTCYGIVWFLAVTALENAYSGIGISVFYALFSSAFNWYILARMKPLTPSIVWTKASNSVTIPYFGEKEKDCAIDKKPKGHEQEISDDIPLLPTSENSSSKSSQEFISTITS
ncbi:adhesion G protein-coupled receptor L3-like [Agrilus planipennis]|uniref:Adhesion G protein-coupled receptor L3-like n=1 Tax=Agrilus planipennis TaxID=224129 RepID=A0A1W4WTJ4_AGRPL|nr:adhesion G protein-coupled receptor L3-like [Agrilus planipennis]